MSKRKTFSKAFKLEAINLLENSDMTAVDVARQLGIRRNQLYKWQAQYKAEGEQAFERGVKQTRTVIIYRKLLVNFCKACKIIRECPRLFVKVSQIKLHKIKRILKSLKRM